VRSDGGDRGYSGIFDAGSGEWHCNRNDLQTGTAEGGMAELAACGHVNLRSRTSEGAWQRVECLMETFLTALDRSVLDLLVGVIIEVVGLGCRRVAARAESWGSTWRHMRLSSATDPSLILRTRPCRPDSWISSANVAAMKAWKGLIAILNM
jgi:hypothetical protein